MRQKLKVNMILMELIFLLIVVGGSSLIYSVFAPWYYSRQKSLVIQEAFDEVKRMDMMNLSADDLDTVKSYEAENLTFTICDNHFKAIYTTRNNAEMQIHRNIKVNLGSFSRRPKVLIQKTRGPESIRLLGKFSQDGTKYFICIKENVEKVYSSFFYTERFLVVVIILALLIGSVVMYWQSRRIARPIEDIAQISKRIAEHDFSVRVKEYNTYQEINSLACNFNNMADQLQYHIQKLEQGKDSLEQDNALLQAENMQRERLERMRKEFVANVSHELKTPLAVISSQVELLQSMGEKVDREYYFQSIRDEVQKMSDMVGNLLNISSIEHRLEHMEMAELNLSEVLEYMSLRYEALFRQKNLKVRTAIEPDCVVLANREYIEQAMNNYIMNAFAHTGEGRHMEFILVKEGSDVKVSVYNEGEAIPAAEMERIWENYYQSVQLKDHTGLGLYIVRSIIHMHGGKCGVENNRNGVSFWFTIPAKTPLQSPKAPVQ